MSIQSGVAGTMLDKLTIDSFLPHVGETFHVVADGHEDAFTLLEARPARRPNPLAARAPFSLLFRGERTDLRYDHMIAMSHASLGTVEIAISPLMRLADGRHEYQAIFN